MEIKVPYLAEGVESGTVVSILVKEGDRVEVDQTVAELETNKATAPIPATGAGVVSKVHVKEGQEVSVGQTLFSVSEGGAAVGKSEKQQKPSKEEPKASASQAPETVKPLPVGEPVAASKEYQYESKSGFPPPASPSLRKMARDLGIDLNRVKGTERGGRITVADVRAYIAYLQQTVHTAKGAAGSTSKPGVPLSVDFSKWGTIEKKPMSPLRKKISERMTESWTSIPHVTQFDEADITEVLGLRKKYLKDYDAKGVKLTLTSFIIRSVLEALKSLPVLNASLDEAEQSIVYKSYYHIGIAVDTEQGLIVPVLKDVDKKNMLEFSKDLQILAEKTRQRKVGIDELQGSSFTISNLGGIGGTFFTPIINRPDSAILAVGRGVLKPVVLTGGKVEPRTMLPLGVSYDHRIVDGADGARFIRRVVETLEHFDESWLRLKETGKSKPNVKNTKSKPKKGKR